MKRGMLPSPKPDGSKVACGIRVKWVHPIPTIINTAQAKSVETV